MPPAECEMNCVWKENIKINDTHSFNETLASESMQNSYLIKNNGTRK